LTFWVSAPSAVPRNVWFEVRFPSPIPLPVSIALILDVWLFGARFIFRNNSFFER